MNAWLLTWEGLKLPASTGESKIVAILSGRKSMTAVYDIVEVIYGRCVWNAHEQTIYANKPNARASQFKVLGGYQGEILYGSDTLIYARKVVNLRVQKSIDTVAETVFWTEQAIYANVMSGSGLVEIRSAEDKSHSRKAVSLAPFH